MVIGLESNVKSAVLGSGQGWEGNLTGEVKTSITKSLLPERADESFIGSARYLPTHNKLPLWFPSSFYIICSDILLLMYEKPQRDVRSKICNPLPYYPQEVNFEFDIFPDKCPL